MSKVKQADIDQLIVLVGGRENIATVSHCITRLRFVLNDPAKANPKAIEELKMVKGCFTNAGQFQVVIGNHVHDVWQAVRSEAGLTDESQPVTEKGEKTSLLGQLIDIVSGIFTPFIGVLAATGLLKGFLALAVVPFV